MGEYTFHLKNNIDRQYINGPNKGENKAVAKDIGFIYNVSFRK